MSNKNFEIITLKKENIEDFASERNLLMKKSNYEWLFFVDSDERVSKEMTQEILRKIESTHANAFYVFRKNYFLKQYVGTDKIIRILRKNSGSWNRSVHETFILGSSDNEVGLIENPLIHNTSDKLSEYVNKINFYSKLHSRENIKEGKKSNLFKIMVYPFCKFFITYLKSKNVVFSIMQSLHSFLSWSQIWLYQQK